LNGITEDIAFSQRLRKAVSIAWEIFGRKVGGGLVPINKEASMQLQYAYILKQVLPLIIHHPDESADVELETRVIGQLTDNNIDILVFGTSSAGDVKIVIEMKCYRNISASGGPRGAHDIFMKDVYEDLHVLEEYLAEGIAQQAVGLVMVDLPRFVRPTMKRGKCWAYDISNGFVFPGGEITVKVGSSPVHVKLVKSYAFNWTEIGQFWFAELVGQ
jgi:hypothetical protein